MKLSFCIIAVTFLQIIDRHSINGYVAPGNCYSLDKTKNYASHFGSKTVYPLPTYEIGQELYNIPGCTPKKIWIFQRHGTRNPKDSDMKDYAYLYSLKSLLNKTKDLCPEDFKLLKNWTYDNKRPAMILSERGRKELQYIAWNFKRMFPDVFKSNYSNESYFFMHSTTNRTEESYQVFVDQLFGQMAHKFLPIQKPVEYLLRPFGNCRVFSNNSKFANHDKLSEISKYQNSSQFQKMLKEISMRLGLNKTLTAESAWVIWTVCIFDQVLTNTSPWCAAFTKKHIEMYEYLSDLKDYQINSYGNKKLNERLPCRLVKDMIQTMNNIDEPSTVTTYFSHSTTLFLLLTSFGLFEDDVPLRADNFAQQTLRKFRGNKLSPFAANFAAVRYQCIDVDKNNGEKVLFLLNQKPLPMKWCKNGAICTLNEFKEMFSKSPMNKCTHKMCNFKNSTKSAVLDKNCKINSHSGSDKINLSFLIISFYVFIFKIFGLF